jgi:uncharacterized protein (TIGR00725 family)
MNKARFEAGYAGRRKIVGVFGGGAPCDPALATAVGRLVARMGFHLLTGAGGGVMAQASEAFHRTRPRDGLVIGIVRAGVPYDPSREYAPTSVNEWVEIPIYTHLPLSGEEGKQVESRNPINVLTSDAAVVLPGSAGTASEVELALGYGVPVIFYLGGGRVGGHDAAHYASRGPAREAKSIEEVERELTRILSPPETPG